MGGARGARLHPQSPGGSPLGYGNRDWLNSAFDQGGTLRPPYLGRLERILDQADALGMVVILGQRVRLDEDDHYRFEDDLNSLTAAVASSASWRFFEFRREGEAFNEGFQSVHVNWQIGSERKKGFFERVKKITGY